jgi:hypothetical protein
MNTTAIKISIACSAAALLLTINHTRAQVMYDPQQEMNAEMGIIVNKLALSKTQAFDVANILNERVMLKQGIFDQIAELYGQLERFDHSADRQIKAALNGDQRTIWDKELAIKLWDERKKRVNGEGEAVKEVEGEGEGK